MSLEKPLKEVLSFIHFLETNFEKVAIYTKGSKPTHMARQLENGKWTSKLGSDEDLEHHTLEGLECDLYGKATIFMKRSVKTENKGGTQIRTGG